MRAALLSAISVLALAACATDAPPVASPKLAPAPTVVLAKPVPAQAPVPKPVIRSIDVIPPSARGEIEVDYRRIWRGILEGPFRHSGEREMTKDLNDRLRAVPFDISKIFAESVAESLRKGGYEARVRYDIPRNPEEPDDIDFLKVTTESDAVLQVTFFDVSEYSGVTQDDFFPRVNVRAIMVLKGSDDYIFDEEANYGADADKNQDKPWALLADKKYQYHSFEDVLRDPAGVRDSFVDGVHALGEHLAKQLDTFMK